MNNATVKKQEGRSSERQRKLVEKLEPGRWYSTREAAGLMGMAYPRSGTLLMFANKGMLEFRVDNSTKAYQYEWRRTQQKAP